MLKGQKNKGFTLVELLVSMCILAIVMVELMALMFNSSKLYKNGAFEVDLQTEAQQIIQQFEELAIDANTSVSYNEATKTITVTNNPGTSYTFTLTPVAGKPYNDLYLNDGTSNQIMGEYVKSISLDMANYDDASRVRVIVNMENDKYSYNAAKDLYFRNDIGANDIKSSAVVSNACEYSLNVLRYHTYKLEDLYGAGYIYIFDKESHPEYDYTGPTMAQVTSGAWVSTSYKVSTSSTFNAKANDNQTPEYEVIAYSKDAHGNLTKEFSIKIHSEAVSYGMDGMGIVVCPDTSTSIDNYYSVQGISIDPADLTSIKYELCGKISVSNNVTASGLAVGAALGDNYVTSSNYFYYMGGTYGSPNFVISEFGNVSGNAALSAEMNCKPSGDVCLKAVEDGTNVVQTNQVKLFDTKFKLDAVNNDFVCVNKENYSAGSVSSWTTFIERYGVVYIKVTFTHPGGRTDELRLYPYGIGTYAYSTALKDRFFDIAK